MNINRSGKWSHGILSLWPKRTRVQKYIHSSLGFALFYTGYGDADGGVELNDKRQVIECV